MYILYTYVYTDNDPLYLPYASSNQLSLYKYFTLSLDLDNVCLCDVYVDRVNNYHYMWADSIYPIAVRIHCP